MLRAEKAPIVDAIRALADSSKHLVVVHNTGLTPSDMDKIRAKLRAHQAGLRVTKNSLASLALKGSAHESILSLFQGPTALLYADDIVELSKSVAGFVKEFQEKLSVVGGSMDGALIDQVAIKTLATLPSLDQLRAQLAGLISAPAQRIVGIMQAPAAQIARVCNAYSTK